MITFTDLQNRFYEDSGKASNSIRNLALAGLTALWAVTQSKNTVASLVGKDFWLFKWSALLFIVSLTLDFLQYMINSVLLRIFLNNIKKIPKKSAKFLKTHDFDLPKYMNGSIWFFYVTKSLTLISGGIFLIIALAKIN